MPVGEHEVWKDDRACVFSAPAACPLSLDHADFYQALHNSPALSEWPQCLAHQGCCAGERKIWPGHAVKDGLTRAQCYTVFLQPNRWLVNITVILYRAIQKLWRHRLWHFNHVHAFDSGATLLGMVWHYLNSVYVSVGSVVVCLVPAQYFLVSMTAHATHVKVDWSSLILGFTVLLMWRSTVLETLQVKKNKQRKVSLLMHYVL